MTKSFVKKGDKVIVAIEKGSNEARRMDMSVANIDNWTYEGTVISSGSKYITVEFNKDTLKFVVEDDYRNQWTRGGADYKLYHLF